MHENRCNVQIAEMLLQKAALLGGENLQSHEEKKRKRDRILRRWFCRRKTKVELVAESGFGAR
jgi:hypothetical protein